MLWRRENRCKILAKDVELKMSQANKNEIISSYHENYSKPKEEDGDTRVEIMAEIFPV